MKNIYTAILGLLLISSFSCNKQDWDKEVSLPISIESDMNEQVSINTSDTFNIDQAYLIISNITISGKRLQSDDIVINYNQTLNLDFLESEGLNSAIEIPLGTYEELKATITFKTVTNSSFLKGIVTAYNGQGQGQGQGEITTKSMTIPLNFNQLDNLSIVNEQEEPVILIDENTKGLRISVGIQQSFNNLENSMWQGLMNANQNQSQIDLTSNIGNQFQSSINSNIKNSIELKVIN